MQIVTYNIDPLIKEALLHFHKALNSLCKTDIITWDSFVELQISAKLEIEEGAVEFNRQVFS